ncbi:MAG: DUF805 domain-containing protein [Ignavibacteriales bacterium]|nr:DUF805 domain-containing protein [Ignavibacteriales bacterium]
MEWYLKVVKDNYSNFKGRARRKEYWMFVLFNLLFAIVAIILDNILGTTFKISGVYSEVSMPYGWIYLIYILAIIIPGLAVAVRRLHDVGKSGGWIFIALIPIIGAIWLLVLFCTEGNNGDNIYGPSPKAV